MEPSEQVLARIIEWAAGEDAVRAALLTGSRADPNASLDALSDFDILLFVTDDSDLAEREDWLGAFGSVLVMLRERGSYRNREIPTRLVQYRDGSRIDFTLAPLEMLQRLADASERSPELDRGYRVLLDKEDLTDSLAPPSGLGYTPARPTEEEYVAVVEEFWWESIYVGKYLARGELLPAKYSGECVLRLGSLVRMLEWYVQIDRDWTQPVGPHGQRLAALLSPQDRGRSGCDIRRVRGGRELGGAVRRDSPLPAGGRSGGRGPRSPLPGIDRSRGGGLPSTDPVRIRGRVIVADRAAPPGSDGKEHKERI